MTDNDNSHIAAVLLAALLWGTTGTVAHQAPLGSPQLVVGMSTFGFGGLLLFALDAPAVLSTLRDRSLTPLLVTGAVGVIVYASLYYVAMKLVGVAVGNALALGSGPVWAMAMELLLDRRRLVHGAVAATALTIAGVLLLGSAARSVAGHDPLAGVACALVAGGGYGVYAWAGGRLIAAGRPSRPALASIFSLASLMLVPAMFIIGPGPLWHPRGLVILAYLAVLPMAAAYVLFGYGLRGMAASTATTLALAEPVVATLLATLVLGERLQARAWAGLAVIAVGLLVAGNIQRHTAPAAPAK
ncbi:MAG: DMT family transporter [Solirubrobacteraceae bacterium]